VCLAFHETKYGHIMIIIALFLFIPDNYLKGAFTNIKH
jgi:hypothetical protein